MSDVEASEQAYRRQHYRIFDHLDIRSHIEQKTRPNKQIRFIYRKHTSIYTLMYTILHKAYNSSVAAELRPAVIGRFDHGSTASRNVSMETVSRWKPYASNIFYGKPDIWLFLHK